MEITPEPSEEERRAILEALADELEDGQASTPWRTVGLQGSDSDGPDSS